MELVLVTTPRERVTLQGDMVNATVSLAGVDWEREAVLIVDMGEQRTGGYAVAVHQVQVQAPDHIRVQLNVTQPGPGHFVPQVLTHPYAVGHIPRSGLAGGAVTIEGTDQRGAQIVRQVINL